MGPKATRIGRVILVSFLFSSRMATGQTPVPTLPRLIEQNVQAAIASSDRLSNNAKSQATELWIHVRSDEQKRQVEQNLEWFKNLHVPGAQVAVRPIQTVASGPRQSQLRFFREADQAQAKALFAELRKGIPDVVLQNMSLQYKKGQLD